MSFIIQFARCPFDPRSIGVLVHGQRHAVTGILRWNAWSNIDDPGQLIDRDGNIVAQTGGWPLSRVWVDDAGVTADPICYSTLQK